MLIDAKNLREMSNTLRATALRTLRYAQSGHFGIVMSASDIVTMIYAVFMSSLNDRFVLSAGHGSVLLYSALSLAGYDVGDLDSFRRMGGLPGHPEFGIDGVAATTGPLGQGIANAVGMAIAEKHKNTCGRVFCLCSDGDLMEGVANEAIGFAGRYNLDNLVLFWDDNGISIDGVAQTDINIPMRMRAAGWTVVTADGNDFDSLYDAVAGAEAHGPLFVACKTVLGAESSVAGTARAHGFGVSDSELAKLIEKYHSVSGAALWKKLAHESQHAQPVLRRVTLPSGALPMCPNIISGREMSGIYLSQVVARNHNLIGGSADLSSNTNVRNDYTREITRDDFSGNFINYGVREHAMAAIMNGMTYAGLRAFGSTFLVFSDYMRGAMRIAALAGLPVVYVLTHDSVAVGQDGPTHQPIEQIASLRLIPNMNVFRPSNMSEVASAWRRALSEQARPSCIILSRQKMRQTPPAVFGDADCGGYVVYRARPHRIRMTLVATGSEVALAIAVARRLGRWVQVVSMPCVSIFQEMDAEYKRRILRGRVVVIEAGATATWFELADAVIGIDDFGVSGPGDMVYREYGFDVDAIVQEIRGRLKNGKL